jgi:hypothetical protein
MRFSRKHDLASGCLELSPRRSAGPLPLGVASPAGSSSPNSGCPYQTRPSIAEQLGGHPR